MFAVVVAVDRSFKSVPTGAFTPASGVAAGRVATYESRDGRLSATPNASTDQAGEASDEPRAKCE
jgi:hypothetical protein